MQSVPENPLWKKPGYYLWLLAITACIYNFVSNKWSLYFHDARGGPLNIGVLFIGLLIYYMVMKIGYSALMTLLSSNAIATTAINVSYLSLSVLLPGYFIYREMNDATAVYNQAVADAKNQNTDTSASVPSPAVYETVAVTAVSILAIALFMHYWTIRSNVAALFSAKDTALSSAREIFKTFPILQYFKYVADNDYIDVAKRGSMMALLAYVVYLMYSVYASKNVLVACPESTCFSFPFSSASASSSAKNVPYVNTLIWTLIFGSILNVVNWFIKTYGTRLFSSISNPVNPQTDIGMLLRLVLFPVYWIFAMVAQNPVGAVIAFVVFAAIGLLLYRSSFDLTSFVEGQRGTVITVITLFIASLVAFAMYSTNSSTVEMTEGDPSYGEFIAKTGMTIGIAVCVVGLLLYFLNSHSRLVSMANIAQYGITIMTYIVGIAIVIGVVRTLFSTSRKMGGSMFQVGADSNWVVNVLKLMANLLFFLPCLMLDFVDTVKEQFGLTTRPIIILLAVELVFILAGHVLPSAVANAINHTGVQIVSAPISMTNNTKVSTYEIKFVDARSIVESMPTSPPDGTAEPIQVLLQNYNYGVSAWFYIHPQPPSTNSDYSADASLNVLNFGSFGPNIAYSPKSNALQIKMDGGKASSDSSSIPPITDIPLQTWNNVVVNSDKGAIDIFVNNKLVYTGNHVTVPDTTAKYASIGGGSSSSSSSSESNNDGIQGEICNVVLNRAPFTKNEIAWLYKTNKMLNPPVVGVSNQDPLNQGESASYMASESVNINAPTPTPMPKYSSSGMLTYGIVGAVLGALFGWLFNNDSGMEAMKGFIMGAIVFGLIGATLGTLFSTDGTVAYVLKTVANVFVDTF